MVKKLADEDKQNNGLQYTESVPFPGARNYGGHLSLQKFDGHSRLSAEWNGKPSPPIEEDNEAFTFGIIILEHQNPVRQILQ